MTTTLELFTTEERTLLEGRLHEERDAIVRRLGERRAALTAAAAREPDESDWASSSADQSLLARLADRDTKLLHEIDRALRKMQAGTYGVCELRGEPIGFDRLRVRPWTRHALAPKEEIERNKVDEPVEALR
jgi:DnaK suppressor protein